MTEEYQAGVRKTGEQAGGAARIQHKDRRWKRDPELRQRAAGDYSRMLRSRPRPLALNKQSKRLSLRVQRAGEPQQVGKREAGPALLDIQVSPGAKPQIMALREVGQARAVIKKHLHICLIK